MILVMALLITGVASARADYYIAVPPAAQRQAGTSSLGPYPTKEAADAANRQFFNGLAKVTGSDSPQSNTQNNQSADTEAARQAAEAQRQAAEAERQRAIAEQQKKAQEEAVQRQAAFDKAKQEALSSMKGIADSGFGGLKGITTETNSRLKGLDDTKTLFLKGTPGDAPVDTRLKGPSKLDVGGGKVPSGLPKFVEDSIPQTPAGDRMRKGFEAIQDGDWKVALAWFQDALNKDPGDPTLQRLVDLAQFTLVYRTKTQTPPVANNSTGNGAITSGGDDTAAISTARGITARARADAAYEEYVKKYGPDSHITERSSAMAKAMRGEGYTDEELKDQLRQALKEYHKKHDANRGQWLGTPDTTAEEVIIGGKG